MFITSRVKRDGKQLDIRYCTPRLSPKNKQRKRLCMHTKHLLIFRGLRDFVQRFTGVTHLLVTPGSNRNAMKNGWFLNPLIFLVFKKNGFRQFVCQRDLQCKRYKSERRYLISKNYYYWHGIAVRSKMQWLLSKRLITFSIIEIQVKIGQL